jgi:hypothetical protein
MLSIAVGERLSGAAPTVRQYKVGKLVSQLSLVDDFSTPEAAYATIERHCVTGQIDWRDVSVKRLADLIPADNASPQPIPTEWAKRRLNARVAEVYILGNERAEVLAQWDNGSIDIRSFGFENGRWLNDGNGGGADMPKARHEALRSLSRHISKPVRTKVDEPEAHLKQFKDYLDRNGESPKEFILWAVADHWVTVIGEIHHRPTYWALNSEVVKDPAFALRAGTIYMELPSHDQGLVSQFLAAEACDPAPVIEMLREILAMGWPDQAMLEFFEAVWTTNSQLAPEQRLRIVLVDMPRPWKEIRARSDWRKYDTDRNKLMAENILNDMGANPDDRRHALFVVGFAHAAENLGLAADRTKPAVQTAGWHLRQSLGDEVYSIIQHGPVMTNMGQVLGRRCLGLFDSAFAARGNAPVAFPLSDSPFGAQRFDADPEMVTASLSTYQDAFDGYVYLGPLEDESFSSLIPGFYTDEFAIELDRRYRLMYGKGLADGLHLPTADGKNFAAWMSKSWGRPQEWRTMLGPIDAWQDGDEWERVRREQRHRTVLEHPEVIKTAALELFDAIRNADCSSPQSVWSIDYRAHHHFDVWVEWVCQHFSANPIDLVELGDVAANEQGLPCIRYKITLRDGSFIEEVLPFEYQPLSDSWLATEGLDWHLQADAIQPRNE